MSVESVEAVHCCAVCLKMRGVVVSHTVLGSSHGASHCPDRYTRYSLDIN